MNNEEANKALLNARTVEETKAALAAGADVNAKDKFGNTALFRAKTAEQTKLLLKAGADANAKNYEGKTALMYVQTVEQANILLEAGADLHVKDNAGRMLLDSKYININCDLVKFFVKAGAFLRAESEILLNAQTAEDTKFFLDIGASTNVRDKTGCTPLMLAHTAEQTKLLLEAGANVNTKNDYGETPLMLAHTAEQTDLLIKAGANVNDVSYGTLGRPVIGFASSNEQLALLLEAGADPNATWCEEDPHSSDTYVETNISDVLERIEKDALIYSDKRSRIEKRKENIRTSQLLRKAILKQKPEEKVSGVVMADEIAKDVISGKEKRTITPELGREISRKKAIEK